MANILINIRTYKGKKPYTRIDRGTPWGNPFVIGPNGTREEVIAKYEKYLLQKIYHGDCLLVDLASLDNKLLACWCAPLPCHGNILIKYIGLAVEWKKHSRY